MKGYIRIQNKLVFGFLVYVKSPTSDRWWSDNVFISGGNPPITSRFCKVELDPKFQHGIRACEIQGPPTYSRTNLKEFWAWGGCIGPTSYRWDSWWEFIKRRRSSPCKPVLWGCVRPNHDFKECIYFKRQSISWFYSQWWLIICVFVFNLGTDPVHCYLGHR